MPTTPNPASPKPAPSHYELLEVAATATPVELRQAFRRLSKRYHPDTTTLPAAQAEEAFRRLQQAYGVLIDPTARRRYDDLLRGPVAVPRPVVAAGPPPDGARPVGVRRALSGGEWFALLLLGLALVLSLVLGIGVAWARGTALVRSPSWWPEATAAPGAPASSPAPAMPSLSPEPVSAADGVPAA